VYASDNGLDYPVVKLERKTETAAIYADAECTVKLPSGVSVHVAPTIVDDPMRSGDGACGSKRLSSSWSSPRRQKKVTVKPFALPDVYTGSASMPGMGATSYSSSDDDD